MNRPWHSSLPRRNNRTSHISVLGRWTSNERQMNGRNFRSRSMTIVVFFYLHRALFPSLIESLKPNGVLIYETFTIDNYLRHRHPRRWEFCLAHNELLRLTSTLRVLSYDEGKHDGGHEPGPTFTAQLVAQRASPSSLPCESA